MQHKPWCTLCFSMQECNDFGKTLFYLYHIQCTTNLGVRHVSVCIFPAAYLPPGSRGRRARLHVQWRGELT